MSLGRWEGDALSLFSLLPLCGLRCELLAGRRGDAAAALCHAASLQWTFISPEV